MSEHDHVRVLSPSTARFCPLCAGILRRERLPHDDRDQAVCSRCGFVFYLNPKLVAATIPERDGQIVLTRRSIDPARGKWTFPGGFVEFGEPAAAAAVRETLEETGLTVDIAGLVGVYSYPDAPVIIVYRAAVTGGSPRTCAENDAVTWVKPEDIPWSELAFPSTRDALAEFVASRDARGRSG
jgi:ADP-ribose pyrophosphatase YjhB (NUDIX family)